MKWFQSLLSLIPWAIPKKKKALFEYGYKEIVDCGKVIGYTVDEFTLSEIPTTYCIIHYDKDGRAHIVPCLAKQPTSPQPDVLLTFYQKKWFRESVFLCTRSALCDAVGQKLRSVFVDWTQHVIRLYCFFDGEISEEDKEEMRCVETEILGHYPPFGISVVAQCIRVDYPYPVPKVRGECVYSVDPIFSKKDPNIRCLYPELAKEFSKRVPVLLYAKDGTAHLVPYHPQGNCMNFVDLFLSK